MQIITHRTQLTDLFLMSMKSLPNGTGRIVEIARGMHELMEEGLVEIQGDLLYEWQYQKRWVKTELKKNGLIDFEKRGNKSFWSFV